MNVRLILGCMLIALAACGEEPEPEARNMSAEEVAAELSAVRIEPGLWETTSQIVDVSAPNLPIEAKNMMIRRSANSVRTASRRNRPHGQTPISSPPSRTATAPIRTSLCRTVG